MLILSAYRLEAEGLSDIQRDSRMADIAVAIGSWLLSKGVIDPNSDSGAFQSKTAAGDGAYVRNRVSAGPGYFEEVTLTEYSRAGLTFTTRLASIASKHRVIVHATLSVTSASTFVAPIATDPRCPAIIRTLLARFTDWTLNGTPISAPKASEALGHGGAVTLSDEITSSSRALPLVVVSLNDGESVWPGIADSIALDLAGIAHVVQIDEDASWSLTDLIGKRNSCYLGAIRLYWPMKAPEGSEHRFVGTVWTASALLSSDIDGNGEGRFRTALRRLIMGTAALTISQPAEIREIQSADARKRIDEIQAHSNAKSEELEIARLYVSENDQLRAELGEIKSQVNGLLARAQSAEYALDLAKSATLAVSPYAPENDEDTEPEPGDVRFYKKMHSKPAYDVLVPVHDCGHNSWQGAAKADKAKKGIERLESRNDWKNVQHCGSCTGGGMWKVRW